MDPGRAPQAVFLAHPLDEIRRRPRSIFGRPHYFAISNRSGDFVTDPGMHYITIAMRLPLRQMIPKTKLEQSPLRPLAVSAQDRKCDLAVA
jgi:hypothetical protein